VVSLLSIELFFVTWQAAITRVISIPGDYGPCFPVATTKVGHVAAAACFLVPAIADTIFTALCMYQAARLAKIGQATDLLKLFVRDGILYFVITASVNLLEAAFFLQPIESIQPLNAAAALILSSIMSCRLILSLRSFEDLRGISSNDPHFNSHSSQGVSTGPNNSSSSPSSRIGIRRNQKMPSPILVTKDVMVSLSTKEGDSPPDIPLSHFGVAHKGSGKNHADIDLEVQGHKEHGSDSYGAV